jgi:hypothetical protein
MRKIASVLVTLVIIMSPAAVYAQQDTDVCLQAQADAKQDINSWLWIGAGFVFNLLGVGAAYLVKPSPPPDRLLGKPADYVDSYTECYVKQSRKSQGGYAWIGCGAAGVVSIITTTVITLVAADAAATSCSDAASSACSNAISTSCSNACASTTSISPFGRR